MHIRQRVSDVLPGVAVAGAIAVAAFLAESLEARLFGQAWIDGLVVAILLGTLLHSVFGLHPRLVAGVHFASKTLLEVAIVLLGASISIAAIGSAGLVLVGSVIAVVVFGLLSSYGIGRLLGLPRQQAILVACGNSICGNSAIVAAAPIISAEPDDVASSIAFTAALGIIVVLLLPLAPAILGFDQRQYGILAGLTVYAVPQVLAATVPVGHLSVQVGTLVKLMRVLMLGPVMLLLGMTVGRSDGQKVSITHLAPWFIIGFLALMLCRSAGVIPEAALSPLHETSVVLTIISMAALGLSVNLRTVLASGGRVLAAGTMSILALAAISTAVILTFLMH